jgi:ABC-type nitrate/sulfonate/bicarbonate transport system substrate-binding protein
MDVSVLIDGNVLWSLEAHGGTPCTFTGDACQSDDTKQKVIDALTEALHQAQGQLGRLDVVDAVVDVRAAAAKIDRYVPIAVMRHDNPGREHTKEAPVGSMLASGPKGLKIGVVRKPHIALVAALDDDNVAGV